MGTYNSMVIVGVLKDEYVDEMTRLLSSTEDDDNVWVTSTIPQLRDFGTTHERAGSIPNGGSSYVSKGYEAFIEASGCCKINGNVFYMAANIKNYDNELEDFRDICKNILCTQVSFSIQGEERSPDTQDTTDGTEFNRDLIYSVLDKDVYEAYIKSRGRKEYLYDDYDPWFNPYRM